MDISETLAPASEQLDAIELVGGPRTFVIERVSAGNADQPVNVFLVDFPRPWRPGKSMRRVLAACWGTDATAWAGRYVTLYFDPEVTFGKDRPGGTRIKALSHIDGTKRVPLLVSRGKSATYTVEPLTDPAPTKPARTAAPTAARIPELMAAFDTAHIPNGDRGRFIAETLGHAATPATMTSADVDTVIAALAELTTPATDPADDAWLNGEPA